MTRILGGVATVISALLAGCGSSAAAGAADAGQDARSVHARGAAVGPDDGGGELVPTAPAASGASDSGGMDATGVGDGGSIGAKVRGDDSGVTATRVSDFLDSIGVCTHVGQGVDAPAPSARALAFAGIRNVRDDGRPAHVADWISMHQSAGVRVCILTNQDVAQTISMAEALNAAGALLAVEGPNEPNNFPVSYQGASSSGATFQPVAHLQRDLYAAVKADPQLVGIAVYHSSEAGGSEPDNVGLQFLTIPQGAGAAMPDGTKYADYANTHNYVCGHSSKLVDNVAWSASDPTLNGDWDGPYVEYGHTWRGGFTGYSDSELSTLPRVTTETGWVTSGTGALTTEQQGRLFLNLYLSAFRRGVSSTFIYMLRDDPSQGAWGLFDSDYNPKTSGVYLHNLTTILADSGWSSPGKLDYAIANQPPTVHDLLLQKSSGLFELVVWDERLTGGSDSVKVDLTTSRDRVTSYDPTTGTAPTAIWRNVTSVALSLSDHPMVLEL